MTKHDGHHFMCHLYISSIEISIQILCSFLIRSFFLSLLSSKSSLYTLDTNPMSDLRHVRYKTYKYFSHSVACLIILFYWWCLLKHSSVQFSCSVVSDSLRPHELQYARPPCPSPAPGVHSDSHPSSQWCHPAISSWVVPFSSCPQSLPASWSFPMSQLFTWGGQSTGVSALVSVLPKNTQG